MTDVYDPGPDPFLTPPADQCECGHFTEWHVNPTKAILGKCRHNDCACPSYAWDGAATDLYPEEGNQ